MPSSYPRMYQPFSLLKSISLAAQAMFYATFPVLKIADSVPLADSWRGWGYEQATADGGENNHAAAYGKILPAKKEKVERMVNCRACVRSTYQT